MKTFLSTLNFIFLSFFSKKVNTWLFLAGFFDTLYPLKNDTPVKLRLQA